MPAASPIELQTEHLEKAFGEHVVLKDIEFAVKSGEIIAIVGGSGSGKTVLLDHLTGLLQPDSGRVLAADHNEPADTSGQWPLVDLGKSDSDRLDRLRLHWSVVFQRNALFSGSVRENIALWLREHTSLGEQEIDGRVRESLRAVQLDVSDVIEKDRDALSGGMAKRVAIARAIAADPIVVFYDEPTTGLDPAVGGAIHELIWNMHHKPVGPRPDGPPSEPTILERMVERVPLVEALIPESVLHPADEGLREGESAHREAAQRAAASRDGRTTPATRGRKAQSGDQPARTTIIVTHDKDLLRRLRPRVVMLDGGVVCFDGPYERFGQDGSEPARAYLETMPELHARV